MARRYRRRKKTSPGRRRATLGRSAVLICAVAIISLICTGYPLWSHYVHRHHVHIPLALVGINFFFVTAAVWSVTRWWRSKPK
jgi:hypothetical protein